MSRNPITNNAHSGEKAKNPVHVPITRPDVSVPRLVLESRIIPRESIISSLL